MTSKQKPNDQPLPDYLSAISGRVSRLSGRSQLNYDRHNELTTVITIVSTSTSTPSLSLDKTRSIMTRYDSQGACNQCTPQAPTPTNTTTNVMHPSRLGIPHRRTSPGSPASTICNVFEQGEELSVVDSTGIFNVAHLPLTTRGLVSRLMGESIRGVSVHRQSG